MLYKSTLIIAEAGVNHNGSINRAKEMIEVAAQAGADFVKFQTFRAEALVTRYAVKAKYQENLTDSNESQFGMIKKLELDLNAHQILIQHCKKQNIGFLSTPFDHESIDLLSHLNIPFYKIPSGEITNLPYLRHIGSIRKPIIMSTGMSTIDEVNNALKILLEAGAKKDKITILHCNTEYPTPIEDVNLNAMLTIREKTGVQVGYSDHTLGIEVPIAAVALGAKIIEKHFTLDRNLPGPDHFSSLDPDQLKSMIISIRNIEKCMGNGEKKPTKSELQNISIARKSIVAKKPIKKGEKFSVNNLTIKRPGTGINPMDWDRILDKKSKNNYNIDDLISDKDI
tara:strand:+ start:9667 stop:10686 length:1020 start_codon:yes stop_codon:yes gene_type:complete